MVEQTFSAFDSAALTVSDASPSLTAGTSIINNSATSGGTISVYGGGIAQGTIVRTQNGPTPVEYLELGQSIWTQGRGNQPILWKSQSSVLTTETTAPILFETGAIGNTAPLRVSPSHKLLVSQRVAQLLFGRRTILIEAKCFLGQSGVSVDKCQVVNYYHFMFDTHCIVDANGALAESFFPSVKSIAACDDKCRRELFEVLPELEYQDYRLFGKMAAYELKNFEAKLYFHAKSYNL
jgi:Hint domain-containing protein